LQQGFAAESRRPREALQRGAAYDAPADLQEDYASAREDGRRRTARADLAGVQRMDEPGDAGGPGRSAVSLYLSVLRNSAPAGYDGELVGVDVIV